MNIQLSSHFNYKNLIRFVLPSIIMMICTSVYSIVDGLFVSNFAGKTAFAAVNFMIPIAMGVGALGFMIGSGGSAIIAKTLGEKKKELANQYFSMLIAVAFIVSLIISIAGFFLIESVCRMLGVSGEMLHHATVYGRIMFISQPFFMMQCIFQNFFIVAEKPSYSLRLSLTSGGINVILDYLLIGILNYGVTGAAVATAAGEFVGGVVPLIYFLRKHNSSLLRLVKPIFDFRILVKTCLNGVSELMTNVSSSVVNMLYNQQLMSIAGENGVAAYGVIMYTNFVFCAIFIGYSMGSAPIVSYNYGSGNHSELKNMFKKSLLLIGGSGVALTLLSQFLAHPFIRLFVGYDQALFDLTYGGFRIYALAFLIIGFNIWASSFFTALNNGIVSATISFVRTLLFQVGAILLLPMIFGITGVWMGVVCAEGLAILVTGYFLKSRKRRYNY